MTRPSDRCPGVYSTHQAADGRVARVRLPGGAIEPEQMQVLAEFAAEHGDGFIEITGRANLQLRGLDDVAPIAALASSGLAPSADHDRIRNLMVSPLSGRVGGVADVRLVADAVDRALIDDDSLTSLSGRFLFGFDDGRGDILAHEPDVAVVARTPEVVEVVVAGMLTGRAVVVGGAAALVLDLARSFVASGDGRWRMGELGADELARVVAGVQDATEPITGRRLHDETPRDPIVGWFDQDDGAVLLGAVVPLGRIPARTAQFFAAVDRPIVITPNREILLCDLSEDVADTVLKVLAPLGVIFDATSPWTRVTACAGAPGCAKSHADVRADASVEVDAGDPVGRRKHWVGCDRACGTPHTPHVRVEATGDGYVRREID